METNALLFGTVGLLSGIAVGAFIVYLLVGRSGPQLRTELEEQKQDRVRFETRVGDLEQQITQQKGSLEQQLTRQKTDFDQQLNEQKSSAGSQLNDARLAAERHYGEQKAEYSRQLAEQKAQIERLVEEDSSKQTLLLQIQSAKVKAETELLDSNEMVASHSNAKSELCTQLADLTKERNDLDINFQTLQNKYETQKVEIEELHTRSLTQFENLANDILEVKTRRFTETNKTNMSEILTPLSKDISEFKKKVEDTYIAEAKDRVSLSDRVKELVEQTDKISEEANNLASALKGQSKKQGDWGEVILERVLEASGLQRGREYKLQETMKTDDGQTIRPDVLVYLPDDRNVVIDSKVSLKSYDLYCSAKSDDESKLYLSDHIRSIKTHIDQLSSKKYDEMSSSLDFTLLFVPIEPAYLLAIQMDDELWSSAYRKRIILISPTNLMAVIKLVSDLWNRDRQSKNAQEIAKRGKLLYDKFVGFVDTLEGVGKHIDRSQNEFTKAFRQLKHGHGNLVGQAESLRSLGIDTDKKLPASVEDFEEDIPILAPSPVLVDALSLAPEPEVNIGDGALELAFLPDDSEETSDQ